VGPPIDHAFFPVLFPLVVLWVGADGFDCLVRPVLCDLSIQIIECYKDGVLSIVSNRTLTYNYSIIDNTLTKVSERDFSADSEIPRKITVFYNYSQVFLDDISLFLFGTGPGTFNSRTSFLLNGDYSDNLLMQILGPSNPEYAVEHVYSLWNQHILSLSFNDGTRNQPFSSFIAVLSEYGFLFSIILFILVIHKARSVLKGLRSAERFATQQQEKRRYSMNREFLIVSGLFVMFLLGSNNLIENTEILIYIIIMKLMEMSVPSQRVIATLSSKANKR